jgi:hypothetical protein
MFASGDLCEIARDLLSTFHNLHDIQLQLRVNGLGFHFVWLSGRIDGGSDLVVQDPRLGEFALHGGFELQIRQMAEEAEWRRVSVEELKNIVASAVRIPGKSYQPSVSEMPEAEMFEPPDRVDNPNGSIKIKPQAAHVRRAQEILYKAAVPHLVVEYAPEQERGGVGTVIMVPKMMKATIWLRRGGFKQSPESKAVLYEPESGRSIVLVERRCESED